MLSNLNQEFKGEVVTDRALREVYATDASMFYQLPTAVAAPRGGRDLEILLDYARRHRLPLTPRGAGTSTAGQATGSGVIVDCSRFMNQLLEVNVEEKTAWVEPGMVYHTLNQSLAQHQLFFPVDPSSGQMCTLGGMVANNASGPHSLKYGAMRDNVVDLRILMANGEWIQTAQPPHALTQKVFDLLAPAATELQQRFPKTKVSSSGYNLLAAWNQGHIDLTQLFLASEGTLGLISQIKLRLQPLPLQKKMTLLGVPNAADIQQTLSDVLALGPSAVEFYDDTLINLLHQKGGFFSSHVPKNLAVLFFVEFDDRPNPALEKALGNRDLFVLEPHGEMVSDEFLWQLRQDTSPLLHKIKGRKKPLKFIEDGAVGPQNFAAYLKGLKEILARHGITAAAFGHAGHGHIHINPELDPRLKSAQAILENIFNAQTELVLRLEGTLSGEHGDGILRSYALERQFGPSLMDLFQHVKTLFDPENLLNPGKILPNEQQTLRSFWRYDTFPQPEPGFFETLDLCHGCGKCRKYCPVFLEKNEEIATGRAKAALLRGITLGFIKTSDPRVNQALSWCGSCNLCLQHCPTDIDIAKMIRENPFK